MWCHFGVLGFLYQISILAFNYVAAKNGVMVEVQSIPESIAKH